MSLPGRLTSIKIGRGLQRKANKPTPSGAMRFRHVHRPAHVQPGAAVGHLDPRGAVLPQDPLVMAFGAIEPLACSLETDGNSSLWSRPMASNGLALKDSQWRYHNFDFGARNYGDLDHENDTCGTVRRPSSKCWCRTGLRWSL